MNKELKTGFAPAEEISFVEGVFCFFSERGSTVTEKGRKKQRSECLYHVQQQVFN